MVEKNNGGSETEIKRYQPVIAGVKHTPENIPEVMLFLDEINLVGKKVMLEIVSYPIPEKYIRANKGFCEFFEAVAQRVRLGGGVVLAGDSEELVDRATRELNMLYRVSPSSYYCQYREIVAREREPYFLKFVRDNRPEVVILDWGHADYVASELGVGLFKIT